MLLALRFSLRTWLFADIRYLFSRMRDTILSWEYETIGEELVHEGRAALLGLCQLIRWVMKIL